MFCKRSKLKDDGRTPASASVGALPHDCAGAALHSQRAPVAKPESHWLSVRILRLCGSFLLSVGFSVPSVFPLCSVLNLFSSSKSHRLYREKAYTHSHGNHEVDVIKTRRGVFPRPQGRDSGTGSIGERASKPTTREKYRQNIPCTPECSRITPSRRIVRTTQPQNNHPHLALIVYAFVGARCLAPLRSHCER